MAHTIVFSDEAQSHLDSLTARERRIVLTRIQALLTQEPTRTTRNLKMLRPNPMARFELRIRDFRVFFDMAEGEDVVRVLAIGRKRGNCLDIEGREIVI